jgi:hypothetical protein
LSNVSQEVPVGFVSLGKICFGGFSIFGPSYKIHSDPISRMKPELNKANNSVAAQCPTCHATTSFDAHDASVNLQL